MTPSLEEIVTTTRAHLSERQARRLVEERAATDRQKNLASVMLAELLTRAGDALRAAARLGHTSVSVELPLRSGDNPTKDQVAAVVSGAAKALSEFQPEVLYVVPDDAFVSQLMNVTPPDWIYAQAGIEYHRFRGFRVRLSWREAVE